MSNSLFPKAPPLRPPVLGACLVKSEEKHRALRGVSCGPNLSPGQARTLEAIRTFQEAHGISPTLRELGFMLGIGSTNGVNDHLKGLERKGFIVRNKFTARAIVLTEKGKNEGRAA